MRFPLPNNLRARLPVWDDVKSSFAKVGVPILATSLTLTAAILGIRQLGFLQGAELAAYDHFIQTQPDRGPDERLLVVGVDEVDLQTLQEWPLSDRTLANAIKKLEAFQPRVIGIDVLRDIPIEPGRAELLKQLKISDRTIIVCKVNSAREFGAAPPPGIPLEKVGTADLVIDPGGILRRALLWLTPPENSKLIIKKHLCNDPNNTLLSFSLNLALTYLQKLNLEPKMTEAGQFQIGSTLLPEFQTNMGGYRNADVGGYQLLLRYRSRDNAATQVRLTDVLNGKVAPELIRDRIVLIGYTTPQAKDDFYTPYSSSKNDLQKMPGVIVHAQSISQILGAVLDRQPLIWVWSPLVEALWVFAWSLLAGVLAWYLRHPLWFSVAAVSTIVTLYAIALLLFFQAGWVPFVPAIAAFVGTAVGVVLLDRFNNSTYGKNVYKTVKTFLKLEVDIDEEKLEKQVAEITETDYFKDLQDTVKSLRQQQKEVNLDPKFLSGGKSPIYQEADHQKLGLNDILAPTNLFNPKLSTHSPAKLDGDDELDFMRELHPEGQKELDRSSEDYELDFIQELKQESSRLKGEVKGNGVSAADRGATKEPSAYEKFRLDDTFVTATDTDDNLDFWANLQQESQQLKNRNEGESVDPDPCELEHHEDSPPT